MIAAVALALALACGAPAEPTAAPGPNDDGAWSFAAVPRFTLSSDDGLGLGVRGTAFWNRWNASPYKTAIHFQAYATSNLVQHHYVKVDALDAFNLPLRLEAEGAFYSTISANFCGVGDAVDVPTCAEGNLSRHRWWSPSLSTIARWRVSGALADVPKLELVGGYRGALIVPGAITPNGFEPGPYPGSALAQRNPAGDPGFSSQLIAGVVVDTRDFELAPTKGIVASVIGRGADGLIGSTWTWAGVTASLAVFAPLTKPGEMPVVAAQRVVVDVIGGDPPVLELMRTGGLTESFAYGGQDVGRGLRSSRFIGDVKVMAQHELRAELARFNVFDNDVGVGGAVFMDVGTVLAHADAPPRRADGTPRLPLPSWGAGIAFRASWNRAFIMRIDVAMSPIEGERVGFYTAPGHPF